MRECNADHPVFLPVRPVAKVFCEVWRLSSYSRFGAISLFIICCLLLFISYTLTKHVTETTEELILGTIKDQFKRKILLTLGGWALQLFISNSAFFLFRFVLGKLIYAIYELGRDAVFSILLSLVAVSFVAYGVAFYWSSEGFEDFFRNNTTLLFLLLGSSTATIWYWRRYIFKGSDRRKVFDHEIGAALTRLQR